MNEDRIDELPDRYAVEARNFAAAASQLSLAQQNMSGGGSDEKAEWSAEDVIAELGE